MSYTARTSRYIPGNMKWNGSVTTTNRYWYSTSWNGGATDDLCLPNCTTYVRGRLAEIYGSTEVIWSNRSATGFPGASNWHIGTLLNGWTLESTNYAPKPGDVACWSGTTADNGHVAVVEAIISGTIFVSESRFRDATSGTRSFTNPGDEGGDVYFRYGEIVHYSGLTFQGYLKNPHTDQPTPGTEELRIFISPSYYSVTMQKDETYVDFPFDITILGIPDGETVSGGNTYPGLSRVYNTGWTYTTYSTGGVIYRRADKSQTLRYERESTSAYQITKHMYYDITKSTGTINTDTAMTIDVKKSKGGVLFLNPSIGSIDIR